MLGLRWFGRSASYEAVMAARVTIGESDPVKSAAARGDVLYHVVYIPNPFSFF